MNKTITINLGGTVFHIEEAAYNTLKLYLEALELRFGKGDTGREILNDIEARMAELLQPRLNEGKQAVVPEDVEFVMNQLGKPEDFGDGNEESAQTSTGNSSSAYTAPIAPDGLKRRIYRNTDDRVLGGVCSGISAYFGWDPLWIRLIFAITLCFYGSGFLFYLILWIAIPAARTPAEKLQMRGEEVNIKNLEDVIRREAQAAGDSLNKTARELFSTRVTNGLADVFRTIIHIIGRILWVILIIVLISLSIWFFIATISVLLGTHFIFHDTGFIRYAHELMPDSNMLLLKTGLALMGFAPAITLLIWALKSIFKWQINTGLVFLSGVLLFIGGSSMVLFTGMGAAAKFRSQAAISSVRNVYMPNKTLVVKMNTTPGQTYNYISNDNFNFFGADIHMHSLGNNDDTLLYSNVEFTVEQSDDDSIHIITQLRSRGSSSHEAHHLAEGIEYKYTYTDSVLTLNTIADVDKTAPWRNQNVRVIIRVPLNTKLLFRRNTNSYMTDMNTDGDSFHGVNICERKLIMTVNGIKCLDCGAADKNDDNSDDSSDGNDDNNNHSHHRNSLDIKSVDKNGKHELIIKKSADGKDVIIHIDSTTTK